MEVIAKSIDVIAWFTEAGEPSPIRFRMKNEDQSTTIIKVDKVIFKEKEKLAGNPMLVFRCQSMIDKINKIYELKYELQTCKWTLFKM